MSDLVSGIRNLSYIRNLIENRFHLGRGQCFPFFLLQGISLLQLQVGTSLLLLLNFKEISLPKLHRSAASQLSRAQLPPSPTTWAPEPPPAGCLITLILIKLWACFDGQIQSTTWI